MILAKRLKGKAIAALLGPAGTAARSALAKVRGDDGPLAYYFDIEDPWSYLGAQVLARLVEAYEIPFQFHAVSRPASDVATNLGMRDAYAVRDCQELARYYDLEFAGKKTADPNIGVRVSSGLIRDISHKDKLTAALEMAKALWNSDGKTVALVLGRTGSESTVAVPPKLAAAYQLQRKRGHYQGAMFWYGGQWFGAIDRLGFLEAAIARDTGRPVVGVLKVRPESERGALALLTDKHKPVLAIETWFSYRSPYSYLALEQLGRGADLHGVPLVLKPIAPMVTRGHKLPTDKRSYILSDAKREADRLGVPFGEICDPLGKGVAAALAISHHLAKQPAGGNDALMAFARSALRGIWSEAKDLTEYVDLRAVVERAQLSWAEASQWVTDPGAQASATINATDLEAIGLWGVPSFRVGDLWLWGQDRLPILLDRLRRHALAVAEAAANPPAVDDAH